MTPRKRKDPPAEKPTTDETKPDEAKADESKPAETTEPSAEEMADAGLLGDEGKADLEPIKAEETPAEEPAPVYTAPTVDEVMAAGFTKRAADRIVAAFKKAEAVIVDEANKRDTIENRTNRSHYVVSSPLKRGYWKAGRHFGSEEVLVFFDDLTKEQMAQLDEANPLHLTVEKVIRGDEV